MVLFFSGDAVVKIEFFPVEYSLNNANFSAASLAVLNNLGKFLSKYRKLSIYAASRADYKKEFASHIEKMEKVKKNPVQKEPAGTSELPPAGVNSGETKPGSAPGATGIPGKEPDVQFIEEKYTENVEVPNAIPDLPHLNSLIEKRNFQVLDHLISNFAIAKERITVQKKDSSATEEMHSAVSEFSLR